MVKTQDASVAIVPLQAFETRNEAAGAEFPDGTTNGPSTASGAALVLRIVIVFATGCPIRVKGPKSAFDVSIKASPNPARSVTDCWKTLPLDATTSGVLKRGSAAMSASTVIVHVAPGARGA